MMPCTEPGSSACARSAAVRSAAIRANSSAYSGFPPARARSADWSSAGSNGTVEEAGEQRAVSSSERGASEIVAAFSFPPPQPGRRARSSGLAVHTTRSGTSRVQSIR